MTGMYFGLEHQWYNTALYFFLQNSGGVGAAIVGGPLATFGGARPSETNIPAFNWAALPNNTVVEVWIYFNPYGYSPTFTPVVEVWTKMSGVDSNPVTQLIIPVGALGSFQPTSSLFSNTRPGIGDLAILYFGNAGRTGDILQMDDWAIYPDFRVTVEGGVALPTCDLFIVPDCPVEYEASGGELPTLIAPARWFPATDSGFLAPDMSFISQPGRTDPYALLISKDQDTGAAIQRLEPRMESLFEGAMIEAFMYGDQTTKVNDIFGAGLSIEDGTNLFEAVFIDTGTVTTIGIVKNLIDQSVNGCHVAMSGGNIVPVDWTTPHLVRLVDDTLRGKIALYVDEVLLLEINSSGAVPASLIPNGRFRMGHVYSLPSRGDVKIVNSLYLPRYRAWESRDALLPPASPSAYTLNASGTTSEAFDSSGNLVLTKGSIGVGGSQLFYSNNDDFSEVKGFTLDFSAKVELYTDGLGRAFGPLAWTGAGVNVWLGNKRLQLGFFDCGPNGRVIGIIPGSGSIDDILNQTELGRKFSTQVDWTQMDLYRITLQGYNNIRVWAGTVEQQPLIEIPWIDDNNGFDLPLDSTPPSVGFGHFDSQASSTVAWSYVRYGISNGYELAIEHEYPNGMPPYLFAGNVFVDCFFDE
jgi:hypothetical protein